jgi:hypothetical protein
MVLSVLVLAGCDVGVPVGQAPAAPPAAPDSDGTDGTDPGAGDDGVPSQDAPPAEPEPDVPPADPGTPDDEADTEDEGDGEGAAPGAVDDWNPPSDLAPALDEVWQHVEDTYPVLYEFDRYGWDKVMANGGSINYCIRWDSDAPVSADLRDEIHSVLDEQWSKWMDTMLGDGQGFSDWPHTDVPVNVVGWAVRDRDTLGWSDDSVPVYVNDISEDAPQCSGDTHDMSLWLTEGFGGGHGGDWGQRIGREYFVGALGNENVHILLHEMGHTFGLDDFYDWTPTGVEGFIMKAGSASEITEFDKWMFRDFWRHLKHRYEL